ncbi:cation diffusion facilitator family transporter [Accumulibacter sp.]|uniref:cation diffusion facilitator family transporter n=1 Tax=Accumulibacter sp. TaxID=2053492 RepID=UPI002632FEAC|nr:cation diffusion facilitator family transporter [Accumulibacter sp.]
MNADHDHGDHPRHEHGPHGGHAHHHPADSGPRLVWALLLTLGFAAVEAATGILSGSLALLGDAGHMVTDSASLALAAFAAWLARRPPTERHTYGYGRVETLAALANVLFMVVVVVGISVAAVLRIFEPATVNGEAVTLVAALGLLLNIGVAWLLMHGEQSMNTRGALLHVLGDLLGSVAALVSGAVVMWTGWMTVDPLLSLLICVLMLASSLRLLREVLQALMEGVPISLSSEQVGRLLASIPGVASVHDLHIWTLSSNRVALSAHLVVDSLQAWPAVLAASRHALAERRITHVTLQPEPLTNNVHWLPYPDDRRRDLK